MSEAKQYVERDLMALDKAGNHYCRHVSAMTKEGLHSKSDIAAELGWRDMQIDQLKQQVQQLGSENAALKSGHKFFMYSEDSGFETHKTSEEAIAAANDMIAGFREEAASDGWFEEVEKVCWGVIVQKAENTDFQKASEENGWLGWSDYKLLPQTPATDAWLNEVRAQSLLAASDELKALAKRSEDGAAEHIHAAALFVQVIASQLRAGEMSNG